MCLGKHVNRHTTMMRAGMIFLIAGALSLRYLPACPRVTPDLADGVTGLLYGLAIGCLLAGALPPAARRRRLARRLTPATTRGAQEPPSRDLALISPVSSGRGRPC